MPGTVLDPGATAVTMTACDPPPTELAFYMPTQTGNE